MGMAQLIIPSSYVSLSQRTTYLILTVLMADKLESETDEAKLKQERSSRFLKSPLHKNDDHSF